MIGNMLQVTFISSYGGTYEWTWIDHKPMKFWNICSVHVPHLKIKVKYFKNLLRLELNSAINFTLRFFSFTLIILLQSTHKIIS